MTAMQSELLSFLDAYDSQKGIDALTAATDAIDLKAARLDAKANPNDPEKVAAVFGKLIAEGSEAEMLVDSAKALAQRAGRDASGAEVAVLAGMVVWKMGEEAKIAEPYFRRVRRALPADPRVLDFYRELFEGESDGSQLMQVLMAARRGAEDQEQRYALAEEMATLAELRLKSVDRAIEVWRTAMREKDWDGRVLLRLRELYEREEKWSALVELLKDEFEQIPADEASKDRRIEKLMEIVNLYRGPLNLGAMALTTLQRILEIEPSHGESLELLAATYATEERWNDLISIYARMLERARTEDDEDAELDLLRKTAALWVDSLGNPQRALEPLRRVRELSPDDPEARGLMAKIYEMRRDWRSLLELRREEIASLFGDEALESRIELARLTEEKLGDRGAAIEAWNDVLDTDSANTESLTALRRLYERESDWTAAADILQRHADLVEDAEARLPMLLQLASIYSDRVRDEDRAVTAYQQVLSEQPGHDKAIRSLRDVYVSGHRWEDLTDLFSQEDRSVELVEVLQGAAERLQDVSDRVELYRRVADLCRDTLGQPERAVKALERTLAIQPDNLEVTRELVPIYREQRNWTRLAAMEELLLAAELDEGGQIESISRIIQIYRDKINSPAMAFSWAGRAYLVGPTQVHLREQLEESAERADAWDELTGIFEERIAAPDVSDEEQLLLLDKLATIARDRLFKPDDAQRYFRRVIEIDPSSALAMGALEQIYTTTRRWDDLAGVYTKRLDVTTDPDQRLETLRSLARLQESQLGDLDSATRSFEAILEIAPDDNAALDSLVAIHRNRGSWEPLASVLQAKLDYSQMGTVQVPVLFELASLQASKTHEPDRAIEGMLKILDYEPTHGGAVAVLERLRRDDPSTELPIMRGLRPYYHRVEDRDKEAEAMEVLLNAEEDAESRANKRRELAAIYGKMEHRRADALRLYGDLFESAPEDWEVRKTFVRLSRELGDQTEAARRFEAVRAALALKAEEADAQGRTLDRADAGLRRDILLELGELLQRDLDRPQDAERAFGEVLERDETNQTAYEALERLLLAREAFAELFTFYRRRVDAVFNQDEQRTLLERMVGIAVERLHDREAAIQTAEELHELYPEDMDIIESLAGMYAGGEGIEDHEKLDELLGRWGELETDEARRLYLACQRAALRVEKLDDPFGAVDLAGAILGEHPEDPAAKEILEKLLEADAVQAQVASLLQPLYERAEDHHGRIRIHRVRHAKAEREGSLDEATSHLLAIARIEEHDLNDMGTAFSTARAAYLMDPRRFDTLDEVTRLGEVLGQHRALIGVWASALDHDRATDKTLRIDLTSRIARVLDEVLNLPEQARNAYAELLKLDPPDARLVEETVGSLCRLHMQAGDFIALVETQQTLLRYTNQRDEQIRLRLKLAKTQLDYLFDRVGAALTWSEVLDTDPANKEALDALERLFVEEEEWERLDEVFTHRTDVTPDTRARAELWRRSGDLRFEKLRDLPGAIDAYQTVIDLKVGREDTVHAIQKLVEIHRELEHWPDVEESLRRLVSLADRDADRVEHLVQTAEVLKSRLGRPVEALDVLKRVLDLSPTDARARMQVSSLLVEDGARDRGIRILTPLYEAEQNWTALLELQELQARSQPSGRRRLQALLGVADTQEERLGDEQRAFVVLCEALSEAGDQPELVEILERVERLGEAPERAERLMEAYKTTVDHILDSDIQLRVYLSMGAVSLQRLGRLDIARDVYEKVVDTAPAQCGVGEALESIYLRQNAYVELASLLERRADREVSPGARDQILVRAGEIHRTVLDDVEGAMGLYERLSAEAQSDAQVQDVLESLYEKTERYRELAALLNRRLISLDGTRKVGTHLRLGRLYGEQLDDPEEGLKHLGAALRLDPEHAMGSEELNRYLEDPNMRLRVAHILEPIFVSVGDWERLVKICEIKLAESTDEAERIQSLLRIAQIQEEQLEDLDGAFAGYARVFEEVPTDKYTRGQLTRIAGVIGKQEALAELLTHHLENDAAGDESEDTLELARAAADLWSLSVRKHDRAVPLYGRIITARPDATEAFAAMEQALVAGEMWRELVDTYWSAVDAATDSARQIDLLGRIAGVAVQKLEDLEEAVRAFRAAIDIDPDHEMARDQLEMLLERAERWDDLLEQLHERRDRAASPADQRAASIRMGLVQSGPLEAMDDAIDTFSAVLMESSGDMEVVQILEQVAEAQPDARARILDIVEPVYEELGNRARLIEISEWRLTVAEDPEERHRHYTRIADVLGEDEEGREASFRTLLRALGEPGPQFVLESLDEETRRLAASLNMPGALSDAQVTAASSPRLEEDQDRRIELLLAAGQLQLDSGDAARVVEIMELVLGIREMSPEALALLDAAQVRLGFHDALSQTLARRIELEAEDETRVELSRRLGSLLEDVLGRAADAEPVWRGLLEISPSDEVALERLSKVYERQGHSSDLVGLLERRIDASSQTDERRELRIQLASLHREGLKDRASEIDTLRALLEEVPDDDDAMAALARAYVAEEQWADAAETIRDRAMAAVNDERRAALLLEVARAYAGPIEDLSGAVQQYEEVLRIAPGQEGAIGDLINLSSHGEVSELIEEILRPQLEQLGRFEDLAQVLRNRIGHAEDPVEKAQRVEELVELCNDRLSDAGAAYQSNLALLEVAEGEALERAVERGMKLAAQLEVLGSFAEHCGALASQDSKDNGARCVLGLSAGTTLYDLLAQPEQAVSLLDDLLHAGVSSLPLCEALERFAGEQSRHPMVVRALEEHIRLPDVEEIPAVLVRLGTARANTEDTDGAIDAFREALQEDALVQGAVEGIRSIAEAMDPSEIPADGLDTLSQAYQATDTVEGLIFVARARRRQADDPASALAHQQELARLQDRATGASLESLEAWGEVLAADADHGEALERALEVGGGLEQEARVADLLVAAVAKAKDEGRVYGKSALAAGRLFVEVLKDSARAARVLEDLFEEVPGHVRGLALCVQAARLSADPEQLYGALMALAEVSDEHEQALSMLREAAEIAEGPMGDQARAIDALNAVLMADEGDAGAAQKLMTLLHHGERFEELGELLRGRVMVAEDDARRRQLRYSLANLLAERLDSLEEAVEVYGDMLADDYSDLEAMREQEILLRRLERWSDVRDLLERKQETVEPSDRTPIMMEMARLCDERLGASAEASEIYGRILLEQPTLEEARGAMERIFKSEEQWEALSESFEARVEAARVNEDETAVAAATYKLSEILAGKLEQTDRAQELLKEVLERRPDDVHGILALADVYEARGDEGAMRLMLQRAASLAPQGQEGAALQLRLAGLSDDPEAQRVHLEQALGLDPSNAVAASRLLELSRKSEAWDRVAYLLELSASRTEDPAERRRLTLERTDVLAYRLGDANSALRVLAGVYEQVADDVDINARIADLLFRVGQLGEAAGMYRWLVETEGAKNARSKSLALYLTRLARIEMSEGDTESAMAMLDRAYGMDSTNVELLMVLGDIHEQAHSWEDALKVYRAMLLQNADRSGLLRRGDIYLHLSDIHVRLDELPKAQAMLRRGLQEDPEHPELASRLQQIGT